MKKKKHISLKLYVTLVFLSLTAILVIGYSLLSAHYYVRGMDSIVASNMGQVAHSFLQSVDPSKRKNPHSFSGFQIAKDWRLLIAEINGKSPPAPAIAGEMIKIDNSSWLSPPDIITFAMLYEEGDEKFYISSQVSRSTALPPIGKNATRSLRTLLGLSILTGLILGAITWLTLRQVSRPVSALGQWAKSLDPEKFREPPPDFSYPELNELAWMMRNSLASVQESLYREHRFLRHASHELRTPISVIRNNVELIRKLRNNSHPDNQKNSGSQTLIIDRIDRASLTMLHMTETLLWLSRKTDEPLLTSSLKIDRLTQNLIDDLRYLTVNKQLTIETYTEPYTMKLPEVVARIVLGNLIRNAFQHTWEGRVVIRQKKNHITIINEQTEPTLVPEDSGFKLGLQLTAQLTAKMGWAYTNEITPAGHKVSIILS